MSDLNVANIQAAFSNAYADKLEKFPNRFSVINSEVRFAQGMEKNGNEYIAPIRLGLEHGFTFNTAGDAFTINTPVVAPYQQARVLATSLLMATNIAYAVASRALGGAKSYFNAMSLQVETLRESMEYHVEISHLHGQNSIAAFSAISASGTTGNFTVTAASWAEGIWIYALNMPIDLCTSVTASPTNTNAAVVVASYVASTRVVSFTCASGDAAGLNGMGTGVVFRRGANAGSSVFLESAGLFKIVSTTSGTLFNISTTTYNGLFQARQVSCNSSPLTVQALMQGAALVEFLGVKQDYILICNPLVKARLISDLNVLRRLDSSYSSARVETGSGEAVIHTSTGSIRLMAHPLCKVGEAAMINTRDWIRIGSTDITSSIPGGPTKDLLIDLPTTAAWQLRSFSDQALFTARLATSVYFSSIALS